MTLSRPLLPVPPPDRDADRRRAGLPAGSYPVLVDPLMGVVTGSPWPRAGVGRPTVYRRWPSKLELVIDAAIRMAPPVVLATSDDPHDDLLHLVSRLVADMTSAPVGRAILALTGEADKHADLARRLTDDYLAPRRDALTEILRRAVDGGELNSDVDINLLLDLVLGAPAYRWLTTGRPVDSNSARTIVEAVWNMARAAPGTPENTRRR